MKLAKNKKIKLSIIVMSILVAILGMIFIMNYIKYKKYDEYGIKIKNYGLNVLYNNSSISSYQKVSKLEAVKLVIAATLNTTDINEFEKSGENENEKWISYALKKGIVANEEKDKLNSKATYIDIIRYISNAKYYILNMQYDYKQEPEFKDYSNYSQDEQISITDLVSCNIISDYKDKLNGKKNVNKGILNQLIIKYYERFIIAKDYGTVRDDNNNAPKNSEKYPYLLNEVDNKVYEENFSKDENGDIIDPVNYYGKMKEYYDFIKIQCESYYSAILNVNYATINEKEFKEKVQQYTMDIIDDYTIKEYVEYVKKNKIILSGKATVQMPIVYNDGFYCRARIKIELNIENSETMENVLFLDLNSDKNVKYNKNKLEFYVDSLLSSTLSSEKPYIKLKFIDEILLDLSKDAISFASKSKEGE